MPTFMDAHPAKGARSVTPSNAPTIGGSTEVWRVGPLVGLLMLMGLALRLAAAQGNLWLDEIWSFTLVERTRSYLEVVLALPHDNNHVLNSLWLKAVGESAPPILARLPAVLFGILSIPIAARLGRWVSPATSLLCAALVALDLVFVEFGSEARGYAGLIFCTLAALAALESYLAAPRRPALLVLASVALLGTFSHLMMLETSALVCGVAALRLLVRHGWRGPWPRDSVPVVLAVLVGSLPPLACLFVSATSGPIHVGLGAPFSWGSFSEGLGGAMRFVLGLWPEPLPRAMSGALLLLLAALSLLAMGQLSPERRVLPALGVIGLPLAHALLHLPNQRYVRFHLVPTVCFTLLLAEILALMLARGGKARHLSLALIGLIALGQSILLTRFLAEGRGNFARATDTISAAGPTRLASLPEVSAPETAAVVRWYARRLGRSDQTALVRNAQICDAPPNWLIIVHTPDDARDKSDAAYLQTLDCGSRFTPVAVYPAFGMSGFRWSLFKYSETPVP